MSLLLAASGDISNGGVVEPEGVDFDGVNDYLSRSTDLVGNVDSKTFTFSAWVYATDNSVGTAIYSTGETGIATSGYFYIQINNYNNSISVYGYSATGDIVLNSSNPPNTSLRNGWNNILVSVDLANVANRKIYINDFDHTALFGWSTYANTAIGFTNTKHRIGTTTYGDIYGKLKGRLSHIFLDYTYRDLSIEANRRLFITADGKPTPTATLKALNPILYLPMKDAATAHINDGTGGNFVQNGTLDTASRGANQDNCVASKFDGVNDYLSRTSLAGVADGKQFTLSCTFTHRGVNGDPAIIGSGTATDWQMSIDRGGKLLTLIITSTISSTSIDVDIPIAKYGYYNREISVSISIDTSSIANRHVVIDGVEVSATWNTYIVDSILDLTKTTYWIGRGQYGYLDGNLGELYFDTKYIDLATSNPFWDSETNRPVPVRKVIADTGVTPLIAMPLDASNAGKNYGSGGDFTANSAPYVGARGASEFWARTVKKTTASDYMSNYSITAGDSRKLSLVYTMTGAKSDIGGTPIMLLDSSNKIKWHVDNLMSNYVRCYLFNKAFGTEYVKELNISSYDTNGPYTHFFSIDIDSGSGVFSMYDASGPTSVWFSTTGYSPTDSFKINKAVIGRRFDGSNSIMELYAGMGTIYVATDYIDFSQEVNRLKFVDGLGYPLDLAKQIDAGVIPKPLIYLPFNDPSNLGLNLGTGGNFTVNGTVTQGADVNG